MHSSAVTRLAAVRFSVCDKERVGSSGMRQPQPLQAWKLGALLRAENEGLAVRGDGVAIITIDGQAKLIGTATEGVQLDWELDCAMHSRRCTSNCIRSEHDLVCRYCTDQADLLEGLRAPSQHERSFFAAMAALQLDARLRPEVQPAWWHGCVDFLDAPTGLLIQVDGEGHFQKTFCNLPRSQVLRRDVDMCVTAWRAGCMLARVHHRDIATGAGPQLIARLMREPRAGPLIVLSAHYNLSNPTPKRGFESQLVLMCALAARLQCLGACVMCSDTRKQVWFEPA